MKGKRQVWSDFVYVGLNLWPGYVAMVLHDTRRPAGLDLVPVFYLDLVPVFYLCALRGYEEFLCEKTRAGRFCWFIC